MRIGVSWPWEERAPTLSSTGRLQPSPREQRSQLQPQATGCNPQMTLGVEGTQLSQEEWEGLQGGILHHCLHCALSP